MKKVLLGTASVLGLALFAQSASAQVTVRLGGYTDFRAGFWDNNLENQTGREFRNDTEVHVRADGKADNGLLYGVHVEIDSGGTNSALFYDEANLYVAGNWGRIELGDQDGASDQLAVFAPSVGIGQLDGDHDSFLAGVLGGGDYLKTPDSSDASKVTYLTPTFAGFRAGISYAPENNQGDSVVQVEPTTGYSDWIEAGARYSGEFSGVTVAAGLTYSRAEANAPAVSDQSSWQAGLQVGFSGFTVGGGYVDFNDVFRSVPVAGVPTSFEHDYAWNLGAAYSAGPFGVAAGYSHLERVNAGEFKIWSIGGVYTVAPGLALQADFANFEDDATNDDGHVVILSTRVTF